MNATNIEWATHTIAAPVKGCDKASAGCRECYALRDSWRLANNDKLPKRTRDLYKKVVTKKDGRPAWSGEVVWDDQVLPRAIEELSRARKPRRVFVESMGDLFHEAIGDDRIDEALALAALFPDHTFLYLTKRAERLPEYFNFEYRRERVYVAAGEPHQFPLEWPLPNAWIGVTVENYSIPSQQRLYRLQRVAQRGWNTWCSYEPALGPVMWPGWLTGSGALKYLVCGGETGPRARPLLPAWARAARDACVKAGVPFLFKKWGLWKPICPLYDQDDETVDAIQGYSAVAEPDGCINTQEERQQFQPPPGSWIIERCPRNTAGRLLDGRTWDQMPGRLV